jgi:hypothetical protein
MDSEQRKEFDDRLDYIRNYDEMRKKERADRAELVRRMQANLE